MIQGSLLRVLGGAQGRVHGDVVDVHWPRATEPALVLLREGGNALVLRRWDPEALALSEPRARWGEAIEDMLTRLKPTLAR